MKILLKQANILDIKADVLICSANVALNLTGGVGADIVHRYGNQMQIDLHEQLNQRALKYAKQGEVFICETKGLPYKAILHAVAVDPLYHSSKEVITKTLQKAFEICSKYKARTVALTALASGFGDLSLSDFAEGLRPLLEKKFEFIQEIIIPQIEDYRFKELQEAFPEAQTI